MQDIIPYVDSHYRTRASREYRALAGLSMGGMVVIRTRFQHLDTFSELYIYSSGHISEATLKKFDGYYGAMLKDPATIDRFRVPLYMAAGETDIALKNGQKISRCSISTGCAISGCSATAATSGPTGAGIYIRPLRSCSPNVRRNSGATAQQGNQRP